MSVAQTLLVRIRSGLQTTGAAVKRFARAAFGEVDWRAPPWFAWSSARVSTGWNGTRTYVREKPRHAAGITAAVLLVAAGSYAGWRWYESQPKPVEITFEVTAPGVTCYSCEPVGKPEPVIIRFSDSVAAINQAGKDIDPSSRAIRLQPQIKGTWHWNDDRTLAFQPADDWPISEQFTVTMARSGFVARHIRLADYEARFGSPAFGARIAQTEFFQDPVVAQNKKVVATVTFTHPVDPETLEKRVALNLFEKITDTIEEERGGAQFTVVYDKPRLNAYVHSAQLPVPNKSGRLAIRIGKGVRAARGGNATESLLESSVNVPGLYSLEIQDVNLAVARDEKGEPNQVLTLALNHSVVEQDMPVKVRAWRLPAKHPDRRQQAEFEKSGSGNYPWSERTANRDVLSASTPLTLTQIPGERDHYELHSFRHEAEPGEYVYVKLERGLKSFGGYVLGKDVERVFRVPAYPRELRLVHQGALLAFSGEKTMTVMARDVPGVRVEIGRLLPRQIHHLVSQTQGSFATPGFQNWRFDAANITERFTTTIALPKLKPGTAHYEALPLEPYLADDAGDRRGIFFLKVDAWDMQLNQPLAVDHEAGPEQSTSDARLVAITDLGLLAKKALDGSQDVFVQSIRSGSPVADVRVEVLGRNGQPLVSGVTDADGHVRFADLRSFRNEQEPTLYLARSGGDTSFLPFDSRDRSFDLSRFDVGGVDNRVDQGALSAYLFSERGLYRPGDEIHIGAIVRSQDWRRSLQDVPLRLDIVDPRGVTVRSEPFKAGAAGFGEIRHNTRETSPAGTYTVSLSVVRPQNNFDLIGSVAVQVRDFLPDRLRMTTRFSEESTEGWVSPENLKAHVSLQNLFGTPAESRRVTARMTLSPAIPSFRAYPDFLFHDPQAARTGFDEALETTVTNEKGEAGFDLNLQRFEKATYRLHLATEGFEPEGGRGVSAEAAQLVSNMPYLIGWKADGDLGYVSRDSRREIELVAVDPQARKTEVRDLKLVRLETRFVSTLIRQRNGTYQYESRRKEIVLEERGFTVPQAGMKLALDTRTPGSFAYVINDRDGQRLARADYQVAGDANLGRALEKNAQLQIALSRKDYAPGDEIEMQIQAPYTGAGLITIERDRVYAWQWFRTTTTSSTQKIRLPEGVEGNAYVNVAFVRDPGSEEIYTSPLSYGVQPFSINLDARRISVQVQAPSLVKPGRAMRLQYSTERPARIALFAVDEGILQVAQYRTPDPIGHFFEKRALEVMTLQILDLILPEFRNGDLRAAPGGDEDSGLGRHLNPFRRKGDKPVVYWSGILDADSTTRSVEYTVPDYFNGTLRVMAVAVTDEAIGVHESRTIARGDFVLSPNAPTTVTPGDEFEVSIGVANNLEGSGSGAQIALALKTDVGLQVIGESSQTLAIPENREGSARFRIRAIDRLGPAALEFTATSGNSTARRRIDLSIRPATPYMTTLTAGSFKRTTRDVPVKRSLYTAHSKREASVSLLPLSLAHGLVSYLGNYPYLCTEQLVSQAMPALVLAERPEFGYVRAQPGADIDALINELRVRQSDNGAYRLWPGGDEIAEFASVYAQHFLVDAAERGRNVPGDLMERGRDYLLTLARRDGNNLNEERNSAYALYLLTRQGQVMSAEAAALRKRLTERYPKQWQQDLAALWLGAAFKLMRQEGEARRMTTALRFGSGERTDIYSDAMTRDGFLLYVLARHFPERLTQLPSEALESLVARITANGYHSLSAGATLLGLSAYATTTSAQPHELAASEVLQDKRTARRLNLAQEVMPKTAFSADAFALRFASGTDLPAYYLVEESGFDRTPPKEAISKGFEIVREYTDANGRPISKVTMGEQLEVHLKFRTIDARAITDVALVDLLPGGFELVIPPQPSESVLYQSSAEEGEEQYGDGDITQNARSPSACAFCVSGPAWSPQFADPREDRVVFYGTLSTGMQEVIYRIKATNAGKYVIPPAYGEALYDRGVVARSVAGSIEVTRP